jgi:DNA-binding GntR family transcriptional regulator
MAYTLPPRRVLSDDVHDAVASLLMDGNLAPGAKINIESVARDLDVSPTPVREALARLESEGLVVKRALKGYTAAALLDEDGFEDLFRIRLLLEPEAARLAADRLSEERLQQMRSWVQDMTEAAEAGPISNERFADYRRYATQDADLHRTIAEASGNRLLSDAIGRLRPHLHHYRLYFEHGIAVETNAEHAAVLGALERRDAVGAEAAMRTHLERSQQRVHEHFLTQTR